MDGPHGFSSAARPCRVCKGTASLSLALRHRVSSRDRSRQPRPFLCRVVPTLFRIQCSQTAVPSPSATISTSRASRSCRCFAERSPVIVGLHGCDTRRARNQRVPRGLIIRRGESGHRVPRRNQRERPSRRPSPEESKLVLSLQSRSSAAVTCPPPPEWCTHQSQEVGFAECWIPQNRRSERCYVRHVFNTTPDNQITGTSVVGVVRRSRCWWPPKPPGAEIEPTSS